MYVNPDITDILYLLMIVIEGQVPTYHAFITWYELKHTYTSFFSTTGKRLISFDLFMIVEIARSVSELWWGPLYISAYRLHTELKKSVFCRRGNFNYPYEVRR